MAILKTCWDQIENLLSVLGELRKLYTLLYWLIIVVLVALAISFIVELIAGFAQSS